MTTEEHREEITLEEKPGPQPEPVTGPDLEPEQPKPETVAIRIALLVETNENLKALAALWGQTKTETAWKLLTGAVQKHYSINKSAGRL